MTSLVLTLFHLNIKGNSSIRCLHASSCWFWFRKLIYSVLWFLVLPVWHPPYISTCCSIINFVGLESSFAFNTSKGWSGALFTLQTLKNRLFFLLQDFLVSVGSVNCMQRPYWGNDGPSERPSREPLLLSLTAARAPTYHPRKIRLNACVACEKKSATWI